MKYLAKNQHRAAKTKSRRDFEWFMKLLDDADEDLVRWLLLEDSVRWCTVVLGISSARWVVQSVHDGMIGRCGSKHAMAPGPVREHDRRMAVVTLSLCARAVSLPWLVGIIESTAGPSGGQAPWTRRRLVNTSRVIRGKRS